jgi:triacylglycerol esterase/lipase EstA (alpha/beta hydrolase family)
VEKNKNTMNYTIVFLPGIKGSVLFDKCKENIIWPPALMEFVKNFLLPSKYRMLSDDLEHQLISNYDNIEAIDIVKHIGNLKDVYESFVSIMQLMYEKNFKTFAYDWRKSMSRSAVQLKEFIVSKIPVNTIIVLIGHSFGGLVARYFLENFSKSIENDYQFNLLITIGTPHYGSLNAFAALLGLSCTSLTNNQQTHRLSASFDSIYELIPFQHLNNLIEMKGKKNISNNDPLYIFKLIQSRHLNKFPHFKYHKLMNAYTKMTRKLNFKNKPKQCKYILINVNGSHSMEFIELNLSNLNKSKVYYAQNTGDGVVGIMTPTKFYNKPITDAVASIHSEMCSQAHVIELIKRELNLITNSIDDCKSYFAFPNRQLITRLYFRVSMKDKDAATAAKFRLEITHEEILNSDSLLLTIRLKDSVGCCFREMLTLDGEFKFERQKYPFRYNGTPINYFSIAIVKTAYYLTRLHMKDIENNEIKIVHSQ